MAGAPRDGGEEAGAPPLPPTTGLAKYISLGTVPPAGEPRHARHAELRRALQAGDPPEELRRVRDSVAESSGKARDKVRSLEDAIQKIEKYKNVVTRRRQRSDAGAAKTGAPPAVSVIGAVARAGAQGYNNSSLGAISKRMRSSMTDGRLEGRGSVPTRQGPLANSAKTSPLEKEKTCARTSVTVSELSEDKSQDSPKVKRKRSLGTMLSRSNDADRDVKPVGQSRPANEARPRSSDGLAFRHGASAGAVAGSKMDSSFQQNNIGSRILSKIDVDYTSLPNERRIRHAGPGKERAMIKGNKVHTSDTNLSPSPKTKACRSPRTSSLVMPPFQRSAGVSDECEETPCSNKASPLRSMTNRKRSGGLTPSNASTPPIAWVGQRPQKMSRTRRANVVSPVSNLDEALSDGSPLDTAARSASIESCGVLLPKNVTGSNSQKVAKIDNISSPVGLFESGRLAATEGNAKEKVKNSGDIENEEATAVHNAAGSIVSSNRAPSKEKPEHGGVLRHGRSGRGSMNLKGCSSISEANLDATGTRKPLKCGRAGEENNESKVGHSMMTKPSDCKTSPSHEQTLNCKPTVIPAEPDGDLEELLAAANAARSAIIGAYSGPFWKEMEPMLTFISSENLAFLEHQIDLVEELEMNMSYGGHNVIASTDYIKPQTMEEISSQVLAASNSSLSSELSKTSGVRTKGPVRSCIPGEENHINGTQNVEPNEWFHEMAPMAHRLLSALIMEDNFSGSSDVQRDIFVDISDSHIPCTAHRYLTNEVQVSDITYNSGLSVDFAHSSNSSVVNQSLCDGYTASSNFMSSSNQTSIHCESLSDGFNGAVHPEYGHLHDLIPQISLQCGNSRKNISIPPHEYQYMQMSMDDKILIELESIGICLETVPNLDDEGDEDINKMISELRRRLHDQLKEKKYGLHKLDKAIQDTKSIEERSLEQHALNKLVESAYSKLQGTRAGSRQKAVVSRTEKELAFSSAFARRTLARCQRFEGTKRSCFRKPSLWSVLSAPFPISDPKSTEGVTTRSKKGKRERDRTREASAKGSGGRSGRRSSGSGRSGDRRNKTKSKQKLVQLSASGDVLGRAAEPSPAPSAQERPGPSTGTSGAATIARQPGAGPGNATQRSTHPVMPASLPGIDEDMLDVPVGLDVQEGGDFSSWFPDGLDDSLPQDCDFSGVLEVPDDDLTQLGFM
ncbi:hypothetical protein CFC21_009861 [Triticum aestivum]|uniref:DUF3741 domain-containing protein n=2 Tax=Triticum aestivum TaxID=4565 RepID=A0A9R1DJ92_WHEAT|nr:uncharacterized protein LOC123179885 isoform X2 [Triticum aestivum]KAF6992908.1 hypothetical protein CFC21_009861 [Triticum aestivum]